MTVGSIISSAFFSFMDCARALSVAFPPTAVTPDDGDNGDNGDNGNKPVEGSTTRYEAEKATWVDSPDVTEGNEIRTEQNESISGGEGVAYFQTAGATLTFKFNVEAAVTGGAIELGVAPATMTTEGETSIIGDLTAESLATCASFTMNGKAVTFTGTIAGNEEMNYWGVGEMTAEVELVAGENVFVITCLGSALNIDYIDVYADVK